MASTLPNKVSQQTTAVARFAHSGVRRLLGAESVSVDRHDDWTIAFADVDWLSLRGQYEHDLTPAELFHKDHRMSRELRSVLGGEALAIETRVNWVAERPETHSAKR